MLTQTVVGWLLLVGAVLTFVIGVGVRVLVGRNRDSAFVQRVVRGFRESGFARVVYGPVGKDALDDEELDQMFVMPGIIVACGLCLTAVFLLGYEVLA